MVQNCANNQYTLQEFLLECPYDSVSIENYTAAQRKGLQDYHVEYNLLDCSDGIVRRTMLVLNQEPKFATCCWMTSLGV